MTNPALVTTPFAENGDKNVIPNVNTDPTKPQLASNDTGFPSITQEKISAGGIPPERADFNGILNIYGQNIVHINKGLPYEFDAAFAAAIGGYPINARVMLINGSIVKNLLSNNTSNPNVDMTGWEFASTEGLNKSLVFAANYNLSDTDDNTSIYNKIIADCNDGDTVIFPSSLTLKGHFISENKSLNIDFNGCTLINTVDDKSIVQIGGFSVNEHSVIETEILYGSGSFTITNASSLFSAGDIGYLWDGATRSTSGNVNYESIKIKSIVGDVITVDGFISSYKGASAIKFYHSTVQIKNASFKNLILKPTSSHFWTTSLIANAENSKVSNIETYGTTGNAVAIRYCYGLIADNIKPMNADKVASGQGYGLSLFCVSKHIISNINGNAMRHVYDQDSAYFFNINNISDYDDKSAFCVLAHNGFASNGTCTNINGVTSQYPVSLSEQGYGGSVPALKRNHPFRNIHISNVNARIRSDVDVSTSTATLGVYFQNSVIGCSVKDVNVTTTSSPAITASSGSSIVRVNGIVNAGFSITGIKSNKIGKAFVATGGTRDALPSDSSMTIMSDIQIGSCAYVYHTQGLYYMSLDKVKLESAPVATKIGFMQVISSDSPQGSYHGDNIDYPLTGTAQLDCNATSAILGKMPRTVKGIGAGLTLIDGQVITINDIQDRSSWIRLTPPAGTGSITVTMPKPQTVGDEITISISANRYSVVLSGSNMNSNTTINANEVATFRVVSSKWILVSRTSNV